MSNWQPGPYGQHGQQQWQQPNPYAPPQAMQGWTQPAAGCESCGRHAPTKNVTILQNIGLLVIRFDRSVRGNLCKRCISSHFWRCQLLNFFFGWWGVISFFVTLVAIPVNFITYMSSRSMDDEFALPHY